MKDSGSIDTKIKKQNEANKGKGTKSKTVEEDLKKGQMQNQ